MKTTSTIDSASLVRRTSGVLFSQLDNEMLAVDAQAGYCYCLNEPAGRVWDLIQSPTPVSVICARLREEFEVDDETCLRQVVELLEGLDEAGLVQVGEARAG